MNLFDRIASAVSKQVAHAWFFCLCVLLVVLWVPTLFVLDINTSQLIINTLTTIITFLLVALLQNDQQQFENTMNKKLDAQTKGIIQLLNKSGTTYDLNKELRDSINAEERTGASE